MKILFAPDEYRDTVECPNCGSPETIYVESIEKPCNCIWKYKDTWLIYICEDCKTKYGIKE